MKRKTKQALFFMANRKGFTLIEALVFIFIFSMVVMTFYSVFSNGIKFIAESKNKLGALALANEKMEVVRNLKYDSIGTLTGIPAGTIPEDENVTANTKTYHVKTFVQYMDDPLDGEFPDDTVPNDYKRIKITVSWPGIGGKTSEISLVSRFVPPGLEVISGDGILVINVTDGGGVSSIPQVHVHIVNDSLSPRVDIEQDTDDTGYLILPGAKESQQGYEITVSKEGYETVTTVDPTTVDYLPKDPNASVSKGVLNTAAIAIDKLANLKIKTVDYLGNSLPSVNFHLKGGRELGTNSSVIPSQKVYILDSNETTDGNGEKDLNDHSPGQFFLTNIASVSGYTLIGASPISAFEATPVVYKFSLLPDDSKIVEVKFADNNADSLLVKVLNNVGNYPINNAQVKLTNVSGYDTTVTTSFDGIAFFPINSDPFLPGTYTLEVTESGFQNYSSSVDINKLTTKEVILSPN